MTNIRAFYVMYVTCILVGCGFSVNSGVLDAHYDDMDAVRADRKFEYSPIVRGWIPEYLPEEAVNIQERHNLDSNEGWGKFSFNEIDLLRVESDWERIEPVLSYRDPNRFPHDSYFEWSLAEVNMEHFFSNGTFLMVIDIENNKGYFWQYPE